MTAYQAPAGSWPVKLDANESPYLPGGGLAGKMARALAQVDPRRYPDPASTDIRTAFAARFGCQVSNVLAGNGSDELIGLVLAACSQGSGHKEPSVLVVEPTFAMYRIGSIAAGYQVAEALLGPQMEPDMEGILAPIRSAEPNIVFISNPNNPTGTLFSSEDIHTVLDAASGLVVVDEAYGDYSGVASMVPQVDRRTNLAVMRTLSKVGGAALRCGFLAAPGGLAEELNKVRQPFNVSSYTQAAARVLLENYEQLESAAREVIKERERLSGALQELGLTVFPSAANFVMIKCRGAEQELALFLQEEGIMVRSLPGLPVADDALRITVGSSTDNDALLERTRIFMEEVFNEAG
jgi:histidinol-phosphate aminotransferase